MVCNINYLKIGKKRTGKALSPATYTIHSTGNEKSTAQNERAYLENKGNTTATGYHSVVDEKECIRVIPFDEIAYHAGCKEGNETSLSLEICESGDREKTLRNAIEVVSTDLKNLGWGIDRLRQHHQWTGKNCPRILRERNLWGWFLEEVTREMAEKEMTHEDCYALVMREADLEEGTMTHLMNYDYGVELIKKLASGIKGKKNVLYSLEGDTFVWLTRYKHAKELMKKLEKAMM